MRRRLAWAMGILVAVGLLAMGCGQGAQKLDYPAKGRSITTIVPLAAGGSADVAARVLAEFQEKAMGVPVTVVNKPGGGQQLGVTEVVQSKPDGYTIGWVNTPAVAVSYLDPTRKAAYQRKDLQFVALHHIDIGVFAVKANSPWKTMQDLVDYAKANPEKLRVSTSGPNSPSNIYIIKLAALTGAKFSPVHFDSSGPAFAALMGDHIEVMSGHIGDFRTRVLSGEMRALGLMDTQESALLPGLKTFEAQGLKMYGSTARFLAVAPGTPKPIIDTLADGIKKAMDMPEHQKKLRDLGFTQRFLGPEAAMKDWDEREADAKLLLAELAKGAK